MEKLSSRRNPSTRSCASGFTLVELLVATTVAGVLIGTALTVSLSSRDLMTTDEERTRLNQSLRGSLDLLGIDIRQTGERLPVDFPALEIVNGEDGGPDSLILRRNLLDEVLPLCGTLVEGVVDVEVAAAQGGADPEPGCAPVPDDDGDDFPDNIGTWRNFRLSQGGQTPVYLFNPTTLEGEWFFYDDDGATNFLLHKSNDDPWEATYEVDEQVRVYMLEERVYGLAGDSLQFTLSGTAAPLNLSGNLVDFQVRAVMADGTTRESFDINDEWTDLSAIEVTVVGQTDGEDPMRRELTARFFPRNILSN